MACSSSTSPKLQFLQTLWFSSGLALLVALEEYLLATISSLCAVVHYYLHFT